MANQVSFKINNLSAALSNVYYRIVSESRVELKTGNDLSTDSEGNTIINLGQIGTQGNKVLVYGDNFNGSNHSTFKSFSGSTVITDDGVNIKPVADFSYTTDGLNLTVDGSLSSDPDGTVTNYNWNYGDGNTATGVSPAAHSYASSGNYNVILTVVDNQGLSSDPVGKMVSVSNIVAYQRNYLELSGTDKISLPSEIAVNAGEEISVYVRVLDTSTPRVICSGTTTPRTYSYISSGTVLCPESSKILVDDFETNTIPDDGNLHKVTLRFDKTVYLDRFGLSHTNIFGLTGGIEGIVLPSGETYTIDDNSPTLTGSLGGTMTLTGGTWKTADILGYQWTVDSVDFYKVQFDVQNTYEMLPVCGQSNGAGAASLVTTDNIYSGQAFRYLSSNPVKLQPQKEYLNETISTAMVREIIKKERDEGYGSTQKFWVSENHAVGGRGYEGIKKGGTEPNAYAKFITELTDLNSIKPTTINCFNLVHGEADLTRPWKDYRDDLIQFLADYTLDYQSITGNVNQPIMIVSQISSGKYYQPSDVDSVQSPLALLDVCRQSPNHYSCGSQYWVETNGGTDQYHLNGRDQIISGEYRAKVYDQVIIRGDTTTPTATMPLSATISGNVIDILFDVPVPPLQFETDYIPAIADNGFVYSDDSGNTITGVSILTDDTVRITLSGNAGSNPDLQYAWHNGGVANGVIELGPRGTLCDSETATSVNYPSYIMRNYALAFRFKSGYLEFS